MSCSIWTIRDWRQAGRVRVRGAGAEVHVVAMRHHAAVIVRVPHDGPVRQPMLVLVSVSWSWSWSWPQSGPCA